MAANPETASRPSLLVVLPALVDHPGVAAWSVGVDLARESGATLHVVHLLGGAMPHDDARERAMVAAEGALQQWALGRTSGQPLADRVQLHVTTIDHAEEALRALAAHHAIGTIVVAPCDDIRGLVGELVDDPPCRVVVAPIVRSSRAPRVSDVPLRSAPLATPAPLPEPPVVTDAVG